jgi:hypothetical protein
MHPFYIANACFILEFMSYITLNVCAKIGETLDMKTKSCLHVLHFLFCIIKIVPFPECMILGEYLLDTDWVSQGKN